LKKFLFRTGIITAGIVLLIFVIKLFIGFFGEINQYKKMEARVEKIIDGDTLVISGGQKVRLLGIDTPELHHPDRPVQKYAKEAKEYLEKRVKGKNCTFEYNINEKFDKYGRLLAYVYVDKELVNSELVKKGYAYVYEKDDNRKTKEFLMLENVARRLKKGVWE